MTSRFCGTCRFYEPSGVWRQGWCRNPGLYGPQESHPVGAETLDCENAASQSFWEPATESSAAIGGESSRRDFNKTAASEQDRWVANTKGWAMSAGPGRPGSSEERAVSYQPEERYWTDYLRIALPVIGLLLLIGLLWYWASALIGDGGAVQPTPELAIITPVNEATPAPPTATAVVIAPTPGPPVAPTPTPVPPAAVATQAAAPTAVAVATEAENPCANMPVYPVGALVTTTDQVNLRDAPSTNGNIVAELPAGTQLQVTGDFQEAGQCDWWPVIDTATSQAGYVIEQYLQPVPA